VKETSEYLLFSHGVNFPAYQGITNFNAPPDVWDEKIEETFSWFGERNLPFCWIPTPDQSPELEEYLVGRGMIPRTAPWMAMDLNRLPESHEYPKDLDIRAVKTAEEVERFFEIWRIAYPMPEPLAEKFCLATKTIDYSSGENACFFLGFLDGEPVATSLIFLGGGVAGLWWVTTMEKARGRGIGTAMTVYPLQLAKDRGYRMSILQASDMGMPIYSKMGYLIPPQKKSFMWMP
jgi:GNAT superfamily N-acetyltransferase